LNGFIGTETFEPGVISSGATLTGWEVDQFYVTVNYTTNGSTDLWVYSKDTTGMSTVLHNYTVFANDTAGNDAIAQNATFNVIGNNIPTHSTPILNSTSGTNLTSENLTVYNQSTNDADGDTVINIFDWRLGAESEAVVNMPFEATTNTAFSRDFTTFNSDGVSTNITYSTTQGIVGGAYIFNGQNDEINITGKSEHNFGTNIDFTLEAWIKTDNENGTIIIKGNANSGAAYYLAVSDFNATAYIADGTNNVSVSSTNVTDDVYHHIVAVFDRDQNLTLYVDGSNVASASISSIGNVSNSGNVMIGSAGDTDWFLGNIDEVKIFRNRALSAEQVLQHNQTTYDVLMSQETSFGDVWTAAVTPSDSIDLGTTLTSNTLTIVETVPPEIILNSPINNTSFSVSTINFSVSVSDNFKIKNVSLYIDGVLNQTNSTEITPPPVGTYTGTSFDIGVSGNNVSRGITYYNDFFWIVDNANDEVYKYFTNGTYANVSFDTNSAGNINPNGITDYNDSFWITDVSEREVFKYFTNGTYTGTSFDTNSSGNTFPIGITDYNDFFWIIDNINLKVYKYFTNGTYTGTSFNTTGDNAEPRGLTDYNDFFWITDTTDDEVYKYWTNGTYTGTSFDTNGTDAVPIGNNVPNGITDYNDFFWITDVADEEVYKYETGFVRYEFNGLAFADGIHNWTADAYDTSNNLVTTDTLNFSVSTAANAAPTITFVEAIPNIEPNEGGVNSTTFNFTVTDTDGGSTINISSAEARFNRTGETTRLNTTCINTTGAIGNDLNFTCTIGMYYFDQAGAWTINVTIKDNSDASGENSSTSFQYNSLSAMVISPVSLNWLSFGVTATNQSSDNDPIIVNNTGNAEGLNINVTGLNLQGETNATQFIFAANLSVENVDPSCGGTSMLNATSLNVTSTILQRGNNSLNNNNATSGQEELFFCVTAVNSDLTTQSYSSAAYGAWEIKILLVVAVVPARRRKRKKLKKSNKILKLLIKLTDELREGYSKEKEIIIKQLIKAVQEEYIVKRKEVLSLIRKEIEIPITIFSKELGALESLVKYMKENLGMSYSEIAGELGRDERTIWTAYKKAKEKQPKSLEIRETDLSVQISIFKNKKLTVLESIIVYLKEKGIKYSEIAELLDRDQRNIWTIYSRTVKKKKEQRKK